MENNKKLREISNLIGSYQVRGTVFAVPDGGLLLVQPKDLDPFEGIAWERVTPIRPVPGKAEQHLERGDILFIRRGVSFTGALIDEAPTGAVASPYLFHLRPNTSSVLPEYLLWHLCLGDGLAYMESKAEGPFAKTLREDVFLDCPVPLPPLATQAQIVDRMWTVVKLNRRLRALIELNLQLARAPAEQLRLQDVG